MASKTAIRTREKGAGTIYLDGKRWYLKVCIHGVAKVKMLRNDDGTPCTNERAAIAAADGYRKILFADTKEEIAVHIAEAKKLKKQSGMMLSDAWGEYLKQPERPDSAPSTLESYKNCFHTFADWVSKHYPAIDRVAMIDRDIACEYLAALWQSGVSARTYTAYLQSLRMVFKHLMGPAALEDNPFAGIAKKTAETASRCEFTPDQVEAIFNGFDTGFFYASEVEKLTTGRKRERVVERLQYHPMNADEMRVLLSLCCWTGCRGQDGCLMQWRNVDLDGGKISYIPRKTARKTNHKAVTLPMHPTLKAALLDARRWRDQNRPSEDYILPAIADRYRRNPSGIQKDVMKIIRCATGLATTSTEAAGRRKLAANAYSLHSFRHTFVSFCANAGVPLAIVAEIVGHGNPSMTRHYSHITTEAKRGAIDALPMIGASGPPPALPNPLAALKQRVTEAAAGASESTLLKVLEILEA